MVSLAFIRSSLKELVSGGRWGLVGIENLFTNILLRAVATVPAHGVAKVGPLSCFLGRRRLWGLYVVNDLFIALTHLVSKDRVSSGRLYFHDLWHLHLLYASVQCIDEPFFTKSSHFGHVLGFERSSWCTGVAPWPQGGSLVSSGIALLQEGLLLCCCCCCNKTSQSVISIRTPDTLMHGVTAVYRV